MQLHATIGAVHRDEYDSTKYFVRPELFEYLSIAGARAFERHGKLIEEDAASPRYLQTVWGVGYVFVPDGAPAR